MQSVILKLMRAARVLAMLGLTTLALAGCHSGEKEPTAWKVVSVSSSGRALDVIYETSGCLTDDGEAEVAESLRRVHIRVLQSPSQGDVCTADLSVDTISVQLKEPLDGRRVVGGPALRGFGLFLVGMRMPNVMGMRLDDAADLLHHRFDHLILDGDRHGAVVSQEPPPGAFLGVSRRQPRPPMTARLVARE